MKQLLRFPGVSDIAVIICALVLLTVQLGNFADDPGVGWHLESGRWIAENLSVPKTDPFLFSPEGARRWISDQWLSDLSFWLVYSAGGWSTLYGALIALYLATYFGLILGGLNRFRSCGAIVALLGSLFAFKLGLIHFILRPVMLSFPLFAIFFFSLMRGYREQNLTKLLWLLPAIILLWANLHPTFILALALLAIFAVAIHLDRVILIPGRRTPNIKMALQAWLLLALCFGASLINPNFFELHQSIINLGSNEYFMRFHEEWMSPDFREAGPQILLLGLGVMLLAAFFVRPRWGFFELLSLSFLTFLTLQSVRVLPLLGIALALPLSQALSDLFASFRSRFPDLSIWRAGDSIEERESVSLRGSSIWIVAPLILVVSCLNDSPPLVSGPLGPSKSMPYAAADLILANQPGSIVVAPADWGGFLAFYGRGKIRPIIDDRNGLLGEEFYRSFFDSLRLTGDWRGYLARYKADYLLLRKSSPLGEGLKFLGKLPYYEDDTAILFRTLEL